MLAKELKKIKESVNLRWLARKSGVKKDTIYQRMRLEREMKPGQESEIKRSLAGLRDTLNEILGE